MCIIHIYTIKLRSSSEEPTQLVGYLPRSTSLRPKQNLNHRKLLLLSVSVEANWLWPVGEVTGGGDGDEVAEVTTVKMLWLLLLLLSVSVEAD